MTTTTGTTNDRAEFTAALRELADFIDAHPDLPVPGMPLGANIRPYLNGTDQEDRDEVDRIAGILGVEPEARREHYRVERVFGGRVMYSAVAIPAVVMDHHNALMSYAKAVTP